MRLHHANFIFAKFFTSRSKNPVDFFNSGMILTNLTWLNKKLNNCRQENEKLFNCAHPGIWKTKNSVTI